MGKRRGKGEGGIRQRKDGRWEASVTTGTTAKGNPRRRFVYGKTRAEVAKKLTELLAKQNSGTLEEISTITVGQWLEQWLRDRTHLTIKSRTNYAHEIRYITDLIGSIKLQALKPAQVRAAYTALAEKGLASRTQKKAAGHLRSALREAVHLELIARNPADAVRVKAPRVEGKAKAWSGKEAGGFLAAAKSDPLYPVFYLMLTLGLRRGEALGLAWDHVDLSAGTVRVAQALVVTGDGNRVELKEVKTTRSRRTLYVQGDVIGVLKSQQETQARHKGLLAAGWANEHNLVFTTRLGTPLHPRNLIRTFKRLICRAGIRDVSLHDLRHTYASLALHAGVPIELVSERLGHTSVGFTLSTYRHLYASERHKAALSLTELLGNEEDEAGDDGGEAAPDGLDGEEDG